MTDNQRLQSFVRQHPRLFVITGAGCSTDSGIPDYRDAQGQWKRPRPTTLHAFLHDPIQRARYWARSLIGWRHFRATRPNPAHAQLALLEARGYVQLLVTQNVDRLHQKAGSHRVLDLHGRLDQVRCMHCTWRTDRDAVQQLLEARNPDWARLEATIAPDGDADLDGLDFSTFSSPTCPRCGGLLKPDVVFFGENVPRTRVEQANAALDASDGVLVVGSSLMVFSSYRYVRDAVARGLPVAAINLGKTRADAALALKVAQPCASALETLLYGLPDRSVPQHDPN